MIQNTVRPLLQYLLLFVTKHVVIGLCRVNLEIFFKVHWSVLCNNVLIYIQQDAKIHSLFYLETALHVVPRPIMRSANYIYSIWYLSHRYCYLPLLAADSSNGVTNTRCCRYSCLCF
jgi:hypothetical protein